MTVNQEIFDRLGYGVEDLAVGDWFKCNDIASHSYVLHPDQDIKFYTRELLRILGRRFAAKLALQMWGEIKQYMEQVTTLYGPPGKAEGRPGFDQMAREWYAEHGQQYVKNWYLNVPLDIHYARTGQEKVRGRWVRLLHPELVVFCEAGFPPALIWEALNLVEKGGWPAAAKILLAAEPQPVARLWVKMAACLLNFPLDEIGLENALAEITYHSYRLGRLKGYPVGAAEVAVDYFRRLELGGLGPEAITGLVVTKAAA